MKKQKQNQTKQTKPANTETLTEVNKWIVHWWNDP